MADMMCEVVSEIEVNCNGSLYSSEEDDMIEPLSFMFWLYLAIYVALVLFAGLASGLTLGLLSLDTTILQVLARGSTDEKERKQAQALLPLVKRHHLLLVTLLLTNAAAVESMPVFLDRLAGPVTAVLVSVTAVLFFGEVIPQAVCSRFGTAIGYYARPLVYMLMGVTFVIAWPIAKLLDCILGHNHATYYKRSELGALVDILANDDDPENPEPLSKDEKSIIKGALLMRNKSVEDVKYPRLRDVHMLDFDSTFDQDTVNYMINSGKSRLPLYSKRRSNIKGLIITKRLIGCDPNAKIPMRDLKLYRGHDVKLMHEKRPLFEALNDFQEGEHLAVVTRAIPIKTASGDLEFQSSTNEKDVLGIITLEDILEELLQEPIMDETEVTIEVLKSIHSIAKSIGNRPTNNTSPPFLSGDSGNHGAIVSSFGNRNTGRISRQPMYTRQASSNKIGSPTSKTPLLKRQKSTADKSSDQSKQQQQTSNRDVETVRTPATPTYTSAHFHYRPSVNSAVGDMQDLAGTPGSNTGITFHMDTEYLMRDQDPKT
ncbi:uncharacterized protein LOC142341278 [Convolutriloba macropyga]|uniref:uncharacterized protein LOC142341278 n=1 Tax=Convolutriloba macropyga TaxID=536237 RepID=UPI003F5219ED